TITWSNELVQNPDGCKLSATPATDPACTPLQHIIQDANGNPVIDQTLHWAAPNQDCLDGVVRTDCRGASALPYTGPIPMVTHVHGAHVGPVSDGYPEAWMLPIGNNIPLGFVPTGTFYDTTAAAAPGTAVYAYPNDQPTTTLWYHDHSLGITRLNVYAASAGFWLVRNAADGESGVLGGVLPGPAPQVGQDPNAEPLTRAAVREIPIAIQPKSFNTTGTQYYPADRAFFEGLGAGDSFGLNADVSIPFLPQTTSDIAPVWNPEAFFNTMVVNGKTWPFLNAAPERYRLRMLNASDSRFLNLALFEVVNAGIDGINGTADDSLGAELPIYQISSEQGNLPNVVRLETGFTTILDGSGRDACPTEYVDLLASYPPGLAARLLRSLSRTCIMPASGTFQEQALLVAPAERADIIVDFTGLAAGTRIRMINTAPDAPFGGFPDVPADPDTTGQVMDFIIDPTIANPNGDASTPPASLVMDANPGGDPKLGTPSVTRAQALLEEESALLCVFVDAITGVITQDTSGVLPPICDPLAGSVPFAPKAAVLGINGNTGGTVTLWDDPISTAPALNSVETWELWNWSADAHPIHIHLVKFEVVNREVIGGVVRAPEPWEMGWKDTVIAYPGEVTRVKASFDIAGLYVWHCHILSHEDNEMMVPFCVGDPTGCTPPVQ
ncbi:MAG: multicopper oxidase domain-containing protein, partial [Chromatiales bacterium]